MVETFLPEYRWLSFLIVHLVAVINTTSIKGRLSVEAIVFEYRLGLTHPKDPARGENIGSVRITLSSIFIRKVVCPSQVNCKSRCPRHWEISNDSACSGESGINPSDLFKK